MVASVSGVKQIAKSKASGKRLLSRHQWIKRRPATELGFQVVAATVEEFAAKGVQGTRVAEITRRAGTTDPTFYRYFPGLRQAALFIMSEYYWAPLNLRLSHFQQVTVDPEQLFETIVASLVRSAADDPARPWLAESKVFQIVVAERRSPFLSPDSLLDSEYVGFLARLEGVIKAGQRRRIFATGLRPALLAQLLVDALHGLLAQNAVRYRPFRVKTDEIERVAKHLVGLKDRASKTS
jgi:AcrR family transcriptional regulator